VLNTAEEALEFISTLLESSTEYSIIGKDLDGNIVLWNKGAQRLYGYAPEDVVGRANASILHTNEDVSSGRNRAIMREALQNGKWDGEVNRVSQNGRQFVTRAAITPWRDSSGNPIGFVLISKDISDEILLREQYRRSQEHLAGIINSAMDAIISVDESQTITVFNHAAEQMFGYDAKEMLGESIDRLIPPRYRSAHSGHVRLFAISGTTNRKIGALGTLSAFRADGEEFPIEASISQIDVRGQKQFTVILRDVTKRQEAEDQLRAKQEELKSTSQQLWQAAKLATMGELAASVAHELNSPLATVGLRAELLLSQMEDRDPSRPALEIIVQETDRMGGLVANLLEFSRRSAPQISTVSLFAEFERTMELIQNHLRNQSITVNREFDVSLPDIRADRQQMRQLFLNLITNAADAMPHGGIMTIRLEGGPAQCVVEISDTGEGVAPEHMSKLFEPFYTTKPEGKGTGLGLPICRRIVEEHGGAINLSSTLGLGTTVRVTLPAVNSDHEAGNL
jgi:PAS domain S-box-containing protein